MNSFFGFNVGISALMTSQTALNTVNQNISNANTAGYSRQVVNQQAASPLPTHDGSGMVGTGVTVASILRVRNTFLDNRYWQENGQNGEWQVKNEALSELESLLSSSADNGLDGVLNSFVSALADLAADPSDDSARTSLQAEGEALCTYLNNAAGTLNDLRQEENSTLQTKVSTVNSLAKQIGALNQQISAAELDGSTANELRDQRTLLVDQLSALADIQVTETSVGTLPNGNQNLRFSITLAGRNLLNGTEVKELECAETGDGTLAVRWADTGSAVTIAGGEIKGYLDISNGTGENGEYQGIPYYLNQLDTFARTLAKAFNEGIYADGTSASGGHAGGVGLDGSTGVRFFTADGLSTEAFLASGTDLDSVYANLTAANITLSADIAADTAKIAAATTSGEAENSDNLQNLLAIFSDPGVFARGTPQDFINKMDTTLGVQTSLASRISTLHANISEQIDNSRTSIAGVSVDEEVTNLVKYQMAYNAASKVISVLNEVLETTINSLGVD